MLPQGQEGVFEELKGRDFSFACHPEVPCFNECCRRLNLVLTPYDVLRLRTHLGLTCLEFLERHAIVEPGQNGWPLPRLKMNEDAEGACPFVSPAGCTVYPDRPGACRMYPLGRATKGATAAGTVEEAFFLVREPHCQGFAAGPTWAPRDWMADQGLADYNAINDLFLPLVTRQAPAPSVQKAQQKMQMFFMACYNQEAFRRFLVESPFLRMFEMPPARLEALRTNDLQLLKFAFEWLRFSLFGEPTLTLRPEVVAARQAAQQEQEV
ncbi:MAG: YkgJ family cysteine cluster protein [Deltaproteobacteria bacterium]|nr:YkgJ family cysteine cluster protein [Deltaproteobacteria bacterium]